LQPQPLATRDFALEIPLGRAQQVARNFGGFAIPASCGFEMGHDAAVSLGILLQFADPPLRPSKPVFENVPLHIESKRDNQLSFRSGAQCRRRQSRLANSVIPNAAPAYLVRKPTQQAFVSDSVLSVVQNQRSRIARNDARGSLDAVDDMK
jgi:hypothetical protein